MYFSTCHACLCLDRKHCIPIRTKQVRQFAAFGRGRHHGTFHSKGSHTRTATSGRTAATARLAQRGRCIALLFGYTDQGLRRCGRPEDRKHTQHGNQSCRRILRWHRTGQCTERNSGPGTLLAGQHGECHLVQRAEKRHLPTSQGLRIGRFHLFAIADTEIRRKRNSSGESHFQDRLFRHRQSGLALGAESE